MRRRFILLVLATLVVLICAEIPLPASARIKCWTNSEGVRECGNVVPPEYAQKGHREMSNQGIMIKEVARAKTPEELSREREEQIPVIMMAAFPDFDEEEMKQCPNVKRLFQKPFIPEDMLAAVKEIAKKRAEHDRVLLSTFATEGDLLLARDGKLQTIDSRIRHAQGIISQLQKKVATLEARAAKLERSGKKLPAKLLGSIGDLERRIEEHRAFIKARRKDQHAVRETFASDLKRYRELRNPTP